MRQKTTSPAYLSVLTGAISLGFHGVLIMLPVSQSPEQKPEEPKAGNVRVVQLAKSVEKKSLQPKTPQLTVKSSTRSLVIPQPQKTTVAKPKPVVTKPEQRSKPQQIAANNQRPSPKQASSSQPKTSQVSSKSEQNEAKGTQPTKPNPPIKPGDLVVDLARMPGAVPCKVAEGCWRSEDSQWRSVYANVQQQLTDQGYHVIELDLDEDTGFKVCQISRDGKVQYYLHLLSTLEGTIYVLNQNQLSKDVVEQKVDVETASAT